MVPFQVRPSQGGIFIYFLDRMNYNKMFIFEVELHQKKRKYDLKWLKRETNMICTRYSQLSSNMHIAWGANQKQTEISLGKSQKQSNQRQNRTFQSKFHQKQTNGSNAF